MHLILLNKSLATFFFILVQIKSRKIYTDMQIYTYMQRNTADRGTQRNNIGQDLSMYLANQERKNK
jgi:hypothetical protein